MTMMSLTFLVVGVLVVVFLAVVVGILLSRRMKRAPRQRMAVDVDMAAITQPDVQDAIARGMTIEAIKHYREHSGAGLRESKDVIEQVMAFGLDQVEKKQRHAAESFSDAGIRDLIAEGQPDEAADLYARFAGVDIYTAREAVQDIAREMRLSDDVDSPPALDKDDAYVIEALRAGKKLEAIKRYQKVNEVTLKEAKEAVESLEMDL